MGPRYDRLGCWLRACCGPLDCFVARAPRNDGWVAADPIDSVVIGRRLSSKRRRVAGGMGPRVNVRRSAPINSVRYRRPSTLWRCSRGAIAESQALARVWKRASRGRAGGEPGPTPRFAGSRQLQAGFALLHAPRSSAGGSFLKTVLKDSSTFDCVTGSDCTPTQAGVSLPRSAFNIAIASATPWS